jgi:hypothetical protein
VSPRGVQATRRRLWEADQRRIGRDDARAGRRARMSDEFYASGYSEGKLPCQCPTTAAHQDGCHRELGKRPSPPRLCEFCKRGHNED